MKMNLEEPKSSSEKKKMPFDKFPDNMDQFPQTQWKYYDKQKKVYVFEGLKSGDFIKIVSGRTDGKLAFAYI